MWPFKRRTEVHASTVPELFQAIRRYELLLDELRSDHELLKAQHLSLRGRVYALWGRQPPPDTSTDAQAAGGAPASSGAPESLTDPKLTKDQLRHRLLIPGKPFKHTN